MLPPCRAAKARPAERLWLGGHYEWRRTAGGKIGGRGCGWGRGQGWGKATEPGGDSRVQVSLRTHSERTRVEAKGVSI